MRPIPLFAVALFALVVAGCGGGDEPDIEPAVASFPAPAVSAGDLATGQVQLDDTVVDYVTIVPEGFELGDSAPVVLAMPPGGQDLAVTAGVAESTYRTEAVARGWVVVSPAAPGDLWFNGSERLTPALLDWIRSWVEPEGERVHLVGVSNGGISAFRLAARYGDAFASMLVFPGFPRTDADRAVLESVVAEIPVRMFVGADDTPWVAPMEEARDALLASGGDVTLEILPGEGHIIGALRDGVRIFDELDALR